MDNKTMRTPARAEGDITAEERQKMEAIAHKWADLAMRTDPIDPEKIIPAIESLYDVAGLRKPRVVIVSSPLVMAFAYGAATWIWHQRRIPGAKFTSGLEAVFNLTSGIIESGIRDATTAAIRDATTTTLRYAVAANVASGSAMAAIRDTLYSDIRGETGATTTNIGKATEAARDAMGGTACGVIWEASSISIAAREATEEAIYSATEAATKVAARESTDGNYYADYDTILGATDGRDASKEAARACYHLAGEEGLRCAQLWWNAYQGGNMSTSTIPYVEAARDVLGLNLPEFEKYEPWRDCAKHGGFRVMHQEFCMVCDFPMQIHKDTENRPHNDSGPSCEWRDGWKLYHIHGVRVPEMVVEHPEKITVEIIDAERNAEVRRVMIDLYGPSRYLLDAGATIVDRDEYGVLLRREVSRDEPIVMVRVLNSTPEAEGTLSTQEAIEVFGDGPVQRQLQAAEKQKEFLQDIGINSVDIRWKDYFLRVPPGMKTAHEAVAWTFGKKPDTYHPDYQS